MTVLDSHVKLHDISNITLHQLDPRWEGFFAGERNGPFDG